jgi:uroporphyrin-III C-methyltransferase
VPLGEPLGPPAPWAAAPLRNPFISSPLARFLTRSSLGTVYLVGAGPGEPELLTLKAHRLLCQCDALVYDALVPQQLLDLTPAGCERHFVGKRRGHHSVPQRNTNAVLLDLARRHQCVVRLKGGDPFLFGRGGEEAAHLDRHGISVEVVPGVTAGIAAPAYVGIPVTHRRAGSSVTFVTGHEEIDKSRPGVDWRGLATSSDGLVIYMGLHNLRRICEELLAGGMEASTPAAVIQQGTVEGQRHLISDLGQVADRVKAEGFASPAIVVVGEVVAQRVEACAPTPARVTMPIPF